ncbi:MAG: YiaA/YiaB family inner membrane protein [Cyanobacteria bacterium P01_G01_bin.54]
MAQKTYAVPHSHTNAWIAQTWLSFALSVTATLIGILYMPGQDNWVKGYLLMGMLFSIGSTVSLSKTIRDLDESKRMISRIDEAKLERLLAQYDPFKEE